MFQYDTVTAAVQGLEQRGYRESLYRKQDCLVCPSLDLQFYPGDFTVEEYYRFEGNSDPADNTIVYAITTNKGIKGILIDAYGAYAEQITPELATKLKIRQS
jgi:hypothetical protein